MSNKYKLKGLDSVATFFVYGTLRPGGDNHGLFKDAIVRLEDNVRLTGFDMYSCGAHPAITSSKYQGAPVQGTLITVGHSKLHEVIRKLDTLEGYHPDKDTDFNYYNRVLVKIKSVVEGHYVPAWVYVAGKRLEKELIGNAAKRIFHGDWSKHRVEANLSVGQLS